jgi:hypothetical protein
MRTWVRRRVIVLTLPCCPFDGCLRAGATGLRPNVGDRSVSINVDTARAGIQKCFAFQHKLQLRSVDAKCSCSGHSAILRHSLRVLMRKHCRRNFNICAADVLEFRRCKIASPSHRLEARVTRKREPVDSPTRRTRAANGFSNEPVAELCNRVCSSAHKLTNEDTTPILCIFRSSHRTG